MVSAPAQPPTPMDSKQSKQKQNEELTDVRPDSAQKEKKRKKKQHEGAGASDAVAAEGTQVANENAERPTKRQKSESQASAPEDQGSVAPESASSKKPKREKRPKKPKDKSKSTKQGHKEEATNPKEKIHIVDVPVPYTNPLTDETLSDFAQRGLAYAYQYAQHISLTSDSERAAKRAWKFNKGRQNWILRNITDPVVIPGSYLPISLIYVTSIQGGARDVLKKTCKTIKKQAEAAKALSKNDQDKPKAGVDQASEANVESAKKVTFAVGTTEPVAAEPEALPPNKVKVKRAKTILKVLKGKIQPQDV